MGRMIVKESPIPGCDAQEIAKLVLEKIKEEKDITVKTSINQMIFYFRQGADRELIRDVRRALRALEANEDLSLAVERRLEEIQRTRPKQLELFVTTR